MFLFCLCYKSLSAFACNTSFVLVMICAAAREAEEQIVTDQTEHQQTDHVAFREFPRCWESIGKYRLTRMRPESKHGHRTAWIIACVNVLTKLL